MRENRISMVRKYWFELTRILTRREHFLMIVMGGVVGVAGGYGAIGFRKLIAGAVRLGWGTFAHTQGKELLELSLAVPLWARIVVPTIGMFIVGTIITLLAKEAKGHGVPEVIEAVAMRDGRIRTRVVFVKALASAICIGSGGSVGREGPIVQIGSAMGSVLGRWFGLSGTRLRTLVACGAAAGIAATFNAPMAGTLFSLEVILGEFAAAQFIPIVVSSVIATALSRHYLGNFPAFEVPTYDLVHYGELLFYLLLGVLSGLVAYAFIRVLYGMEDLCDRWKFSNYGKAALGGTVIGCIGLLFPQVFGVGYETIAQVLRGETLGPVLIALLAAKVLATSVTIGSGGSGGIFAPSLFMGAVTGGAFGQLVHTLFPHMTAFPGAYALVGMGAVVAGTTRAPITAMLIIFEMTADYLIILPLMFACIIGLVISALLSRESIYTLKLLRRGVNIHGGRELNILRSLKVDQVMRPEIELASPATSLPELVSRMMSSSHSHFFVIGEDDRIQGHISLETLRPILKDYETVSDVINASDLMNTDITVVKPDDSLDMIMQLFGKFDLSEIPVVQGGRVIGTIWRADLIEAYNREIFKRDMASGLATSFRVQQKMHAEQLALLGEFLILEVPAHRSFIGKSLVDLDLRQRFGATVMTIKRKSQDKEGGVMYVLPTSTTAIEEGDVLILFGLQRDLTRFPRG